MISGGLHNYLRLPNKFPILADCGAWGYIKDDEPRFSPIEVFEYYRQLGVQEVVTVDHLVLPHISVNGEKVPVDVDYRMKITYENGLKGHSYWKEKFMDDFELLVAVQGLNPDDYLRMFKNYLKHGITSFAIGGLAKKNTNVVRAIIDEIRFHVDKSDFSIDKIHFFGLGREKLFQTFQRLEETGVSVSFDSASWLRQAWLSGKYIHVTSNQVKKYTTVRIPMTISRRSSFKGKRKLLPDTDFVKLQNSEIQTLKTLRKYDAREITINQILNQIHENDKNILYELKRASKSNHKEDADKYILKQERFYKKLQKEYPITLKDQPWLNCDCQICKDHGIEIVIFRGNNRNRRRGFHNTHVMYHKVLKNPKAWNTFKPKKIMNKVTESSDLVSLDGNILIITGCTKSKLGYNENTKLRARELYTGRLFKAVKFYAKVKSIPYVIISTKYGFLQPTDIITGYEKVLKTKDDVEQIKSLVYDRLLKTIPNYDTILVIAGKRYREVLDDLWDDRFIYVKASGYAKLAKIVKDAATQVSVAKLTIF